MAGHKGSNVGVSHHSRLMLALWLALCTVHICLADSQHVYNIKLPVESVADALNGLSEQTGVPVVFPYDLVKDRKANAVNGPYTLPGALEVLLEGTGLSGGLSDKGVLTVSMRPATQSSGETIVTSDNNPQKSINTRPARTVSVTAMLASVAAAFSASAQESDNQPGDQPKMENIVITAQKREERLQDVPVPVAVVNADDLVQTNQTQLRDYFATVPGINVMPGYVDSQNIAIRGISTGGLTTPTVGITIDDVPFGATSGAHANHVPDIDPGDLARVEILRGPQGTLYGADSMGGLVKFVTIDPSTAGYSGRVEAGTSSVHNGDEPGFNFRGAANIPVSDTLAVRVSGFRRQDPGYIDNPTYRLTGVNTLEADGARLSALWRPADDVSLKLSAMYQHSNAHGLNEVDVQPGLSGLQQSYLPGSGFTENTVQAYSAIFNAKLGPVAVTSLTGYNVSAEQDGLDSTFIFGSSVQTAFGVSGEPLIEGDQVRKFVQELRASIPLGDRIDWLVGGYYTYEKDSSYFDFDAENTTTGQIVGDFWHFGQGGPDLFSEYAAFTDLTFHISDAFDVQVGGRQSYLKIALGQTIQTGPYTQMDLGLPSPVLGAEQDSHFHAFTYLFTPRLKLTEDLMVYARLASGYRPGIGNIPQTGVPRESNPDKTRNYEVGIKGDFLDRRLSLDTSVYYIDWTDLQIQLRDPVSQFVYNTNGSAAKSQGIEFSIGVRPWTGFTGSAWIDYDDAVLTKAFPANSPTYGASGDRLPLSSKYSGNLSLEQTFALAQRWVGFAGAQASYVGNRIGVFGATPQRQYFPAYTKTDLHAGVKDDSWTVTAYVNNVGDVRALINGGTGYFYPPAQIYITPRTIGLSIAKAF